MIQALFRILFLVIISLSISSCYEEYSVTPDHKSNMFEFLMTSEAETEILESRGEKFYIEPAPEMYYGKVQHAMDHMIVRGGSVLNFQRKSFSVNLGTNIYLPTNQATFRKFEKFKLISLVYDYTYIENRIAHLFLSEINLWPLHSFFTEVKLNNHHQGLYMFIEDPARYLFDYEMAEAVLRRDYRNVVAEIEINPSINTETESHYIDQFTSLYKIILDYSGEQLFTELSRHLNIQNYMRKMALDYILQNGDYTDEIYFYAKSISNTTYFDILPWDYDDLFSNIQHEVDRAWAVGMVFGERFYFNRDDVLADLNGRLVYSIEDDMDYIIATDDFLYQKYLVELNYVLSKITTSKISSSFQSLNNELSVFYQIPEVIEQSEFDANTTSLELFTLNIANKEAFLLNRIMWISNEVISQ